MTRMCFFLCILARLQSWRATVRRKKWVKMWKWCEKDLWGQQSWKLSVIEGRGKRKRTNQKGLKSGSEENLIWKKKCCAVNALFWRCLAILSVVLAFDRLSIQLLVQVNADPPFLCFVEDEFLKSVDSQAGGVMMERMLHWWLSYISLWLVSEGLKHPCWATAAAHSSCPCLY